MEIPQDILAKCHAQGVAAYPEEACGFITGSRDDPDLLETVWPMQNMMNELHEKGPLQYPRTAREGYLIDPLEQLKLERSLKKEGKEIFPTKGPWAAGKGGEMFKTFLYACISLHVIKDKAPWGVFAGKGSKAERCARHFSTHVLLYM